MRLNVCFIMSAVSIVVVVVESCIRFLTTSNETFSSQSRTNIICKINALPEKIRLCTTGCPWSCWTTSEVWLLKLSLMVKKWRCCSLSFDWGWNVQRGCLSCLTRLKCRRQTVLGTDSVPKSSDSTLQRRAPSTCSIRGPPYFWQDVIWIPPKGNGQHYWRL